MKDRRRENRQVYLLIMSVAMLSVFVIQCVGRKLTPLHVNDSFCMSRPGSRLPHGCNNICRLIIFGRMNDKLVVNTITEFERYWSGNSRVTADFLSDLAVLLCVLSK